MTKHSPAPWQVGFQSARRYIYDARGWVVTNAVVHPDHGDLQESVANAALIAAAPEMLEALEGLMAAFGGVTTHAQQAKWDEAKAAVRKARGED